jgi:hypothetical protein
VTAFLDNLDRLKSHGGNEKKNEPPRGNEWRETRRQHQCERIERPSRCVIVVDVLEFPAVVVLA